MYNRYCKNCPVRRHGLGDICRFCEDEKRCIFLNPEGRCDNCKFLFFQYNLFINCEKAILTHPIDADESQLKLYEFLTAAENCVKVLKDLCEKYPRPQN